MLYQSIHHREASEGVPYHYTKVLTAIFALHQRLKLFADKLPKVIILCSKIIISLSAFYSYDYHFRYIGNPLGELLHKGSEIIEVGLRIKQIDHRVIRGGKGTIIIGRGQVEVYGALPSHNGRRERKTLPYTNSCLCPSAIHG